VLFRDGDIVKVFVEGENIAITSSVDPEVGPIQPTATSLDVEAEGQDGEQEDGEQEEEAAIRPLEVMEDSLEEIEEDGRKRSFV